MVEHHSSSKRNLLSGSHSYCLNVLWRRGAATEISTHVAIRFSLLAGILRRSRASLVVLRPLLFRPSHILSENILPSPSRSYNSYGIQLLFRFAVT